MIYKLLHFIADRCGINAVLLKHGVLKSEGKYYISIAHDDADIAQTVKAWEAGIKELRRLHG